jgi:hypothetical protein
MRRASACREQEEMPMAKLSRLTRSVIVAVLAIAIVPIAGATAALAAAPALTSFAPTSGPVGTSVVLTGTGFMDASTVTAVTFNGTTATFAVNSDTQITATVPAGATTGAIAVTDSEGTATSTTSFTVSPSPVPTITSIAPTSGAVGTTVVVTGTGFTGATAVTFAGTSATFTVNSDTQITATVPAGATTGPIAVTTPGGTATSTSPFTVQPAVTRHARTVTLHLGRHLIAKGRVHVGDGFMACVSGVTVKIQRRHHGTWRVVGSDVTNANGRYRDAIEDRGGRYRATVAKSSPNGGDDVCRRAASAVARHHH